MAQQILSTNTFTTEKWIVSATASDGTHTTIAAALTAASSGDTIFIRPGTYTENLTLKAGVNITANACDGVTPSVIILGKCTFTTAGTVSISNVGLQTNGDYFLAVTGTLASKVNLENCYLNCANFDGITFTSSSASSSIIIDGCDGNIGTTAKTLIISTATGAVEIHYTRISNFGAAAPTASSSSVALLTLRYSYLNFPLSMTGTGSIDAADTTIANATANLTSVTTAGTGISSFQRCTFTSGTSSAVSIGTGTTVRLFDCLVESSNTNAITGAGTLTSTPIGFYGTSSLVNTTTQTFGAFGTTGTFTPTLTGGGTAGTTTYSSQNGYYTRIGNMVFVLVQISISAATGTGAYTIGALPFTVKNQTNGNTTASLITNNNNAWPAGNTMLQVDFISNTTTAVLTGSGSAVGVSNFQMTNTNINFHFSGWYMI